jgi:hypothetical protein
MLDQEANAKEQEMVVMKRQQQKHQGWKGVRMKAQTVAQLYARSQVSGPSEDPAHTHQRSQKQVYNPIHTVIQQIEG